VTWPSGEILAATSFSSSESESEWTLELRRSPMRSRVIESVCLCRNASVSTFEGGVSNPKRGAGNGARRSKEKLPGAMFKGVSARWRKGVMLGVLRREGVDFRFPTRVVAEVAALVCTGESAARKELSRLPLPLTGVAFGVDDRKMPPSSSSMGIGGGRATDE
jgi:hypothetical protein